MQTRFEFICCDTRFTTETVMPSISFVRPEKERRVFVENRRAAAVNLMQMKTDTQLFQHGQPVHSKTRHKIKSY